MKYLICKFANTLHEIEEDKIGYKHNLQDAKDYIRKELKDVDPYNLLTEYFNINDKETLDYFYTDGKITYGIYEIEELF